MVDTDLTRSGAEKKNARGEEAGEAKKKNFNFHPFSGSIKMHVMPGNLRYVVACKSNLPGPHVRRRQPALLLETARCINN